MLKKIKHILPPSKRRITKFIHILTPQKENGTAKTFEESGTYLVSNRPNEITKYKRITNPQK